MSRGGRDSGDSTSGQSWTVRDPRDRPPSSARAPLFSVGDVLVERYELRKVLGRGGMGVVFEAYDRILQQVIALKVVRHEHAGDRTWAERLAREVKLGRQINHPNVCRVFDFGVAQAHPFLTMELAGGGSLRDELATGRLGEQAVARRLADARAIASGLAAIHAAGIVHRDVSPQNILRLTDGTLVLSDFGLATDQFDGTSSVHGGTISYMAPEVVRGCRASFSSDVWSLGIVMHELVFGVRPAWSKTGRHMLPPELGRIATASEQVLFQVCRACVDPDARRRPARAEDVCRLLARGRRRWQLGPRARAVGEAGLLMLLVLIGLGLRNRPARSGGTARLDPLMIVPAGRPADWTTLTKVLAEVPDRIGCMVPLPDGESVRFRWGDPPRLEELNTRTGQRSAAPVVPAAYAEGCPDVTADGRRMVFAGHTPDDRPFAFVSEEADGAAAVPVVPISELSMSSDPRWLADGDQFAYEIDIRHVALYSVSKKTTAVLSNEGDEYVTIFHSVSGNRVLVWSASPQWALQVQAFSPPSIQPELRFRIPLFVASMAAIGDGLFVIPEPRAMPDSSLFVVDARRRRARRVGVVPGQFLRQPVALRDGLVFSSSKPETLLSIAGRQDVAVDPDLLDVARCGSRLVATRAADGQPRPVRLGEDGRIAEDLSLGDDARVVRCSPDGHILYSLTRGGALRRCEQARCVSMATDVFSYSLSPGGQMLAVLTAKNPTLVLGLLDAAGAWRAPSLLQTSNACAPVWAGDDRLWVSVRRGRSNVWRELAMPAGTPTGRTSPGQASCADGSEDPAAPLKPDVRLVRRTRAELRLFAGLDHLRAALETHE